MPRNQWKYKIHVFRKNPFVDGGLELIAVFPVRFSDSAGSVLMKYERLFNQYSDGYEYICSYWSKPQSSPKQLEIELPF